jgi:hypothetical protein
MRLEIKRLKDTVANLTGRASAPKSVLAPPADVRLVAAAKNLQGKLEKSQQVLSASELLKESSPGLSAASRKEAFKLRDDAVHNFMTDLKSETK